MSKKLFGIALCAILGLAVSACTVNVNNNANSVANAERGSAANNTVVSNANAAAVVTNPRWSVVVCSSRAKTVTMSAGPSENDSSVFATWNEGSAKRVFALPERVQNLTGVYFKASGSDANPVELCVLFDGKAKRRVEFDDDESVLIKTSDVDNNDCRCTQ